jgi:tetratricopeptide (TPR) repeat protein
MKTLPEPTVSTCISRIALLLLACALLGGCNPKSNAVPATTPTPAPPVVEGTPGTEAECKEFAGKVEQALRDKDRASLGKLISIEEVAVRCVSDLAISEAQKQSVITGIKSGMKNSSLAAQILANSEKGGKFKLLRVHDVDGRSRALFRLNGSEAGVSYFDVLLTKYPDGRISVEDIYVFTAGEMLSQSLRRLLIPAAAELNRSLVSQLRGDDKLFLNNLRKLEAMTQAIKAGNGGEARVIYKSLPVELREHKVILLMYLNVAEEVEAEYTKALETYRRLFPTDPAVDFLSIDYFTLKKQYDEAIRCIEKTDKTLGGDPYLYVLRANTMVAAKKFKEAREAAEKAVELEPDLSDGYWSRLTVSLKEKNHADTLAWLKKLVEKTGEEIADLTTVADYAEFIKTPEHQEWLKWYAMRKKA